MNRPLFLDHNCGYCGAGHRTPCHAVVRGNSGLASVWPQQPLDWSHRDREPVDFPRSRDLLSELATLWVRGIL